MNLKDQRRFWTKVSIGGLDECWEWQASKNKQRYGQFGFEGTNKKAHRMVWTDTFGSIPEDMCVCHACDNPPCCNPLHLWLGTVEDNNNDKLAKSRQPKGKTHQYFGKELPASTKQKMSEAVKGERNHNYGQIASQETKQKQSLAHRGDNSPMAKLTSADIPVIRADPRLCKDIAPDYGVGTSTIIKVKSRATWKHIP